MWQRHNAQLANFDVPSFAYCGYRWDAAGECLGHLFESLRTETASPWGGYQFGSLTRIATTGNVSSCVRMKS
jgi:hypothetical protein